MEKEFSYKSIDDFYNRVRTALSVSSTVVTEEVIDYPENAPTAERKVKSMVSGWEYLEGEKEELFKTAIIYKTCAILCPVFSASGKMKKQATPNLNIEYFEPVMTGKPCERFNELVNDLIAEILGESNELFTGFEITRGYANCVRFPSN